MAKNVQQQQQQQIETFANSPQNKIIPTRQISMKKIAVPSC